MYSIAFSILTFVYPCDIIYKEAKIQEFFKMWLWIGIGAGAIVITACVTYVFCKSSSSNKSISLEDIIGERCTVIETVDNYAGCGLVRVKGTEWSARSVSDDDVFKVGESLKVVAIEGVKLICNKN